MSLCVGQGKDIVLDKDYKYQDFMDWLQCYDKPTMNNLVDHNGRTIWYKVSL